MSKNRSLNTSLTRSNGTLRRVCPFADSITSSDWNPEVAEGELGAIPVITVRSSHGATSTDESCKPHRVHPAGLVSCLRILWTPHCVLLVALLMESSAA